MWWLWAADSDIAPNQRRLAGPRPSAFAAAGPPPGALCVGMCPGHVPYHALPLAAHNNMQGPHALPLCWKSPSQRGNFAQHLKPALKRGGDDLIECEPVWPRPAAHSGPALHRYPITADACALVYLVELQVCGEAWVQLCFE